MERHLFITGDGSHSVDIPAAGITYHSTHGALQESMHVFIQAGLCSMLPSAKPLHIFEVGFGTGLNALLTLQKAIETNTLIQYETAEPYPLQPQEYSQLNYCSFPGLQALQPLFTNMHTCAWQQPVSIHPLFTLSKYAAALGETALPVQADLIYFDAFAPNDQPAIWTEDIFEKLFYSLAKGGKLVTYCSKGAVQRALKKTGLLVKKLPGPPHKREIILAEKIT